MAALAAPTAVKAAASLASARSSCLAGDASLQVPQVRAAFPASSPAIRCSAEKAEEAAVAVSRRAAVSVLLAGSSALALRADPAFAAYGDAANVFGKRGNTTGFVTYKGAGFQLEVPSKWNPSSQVEFANTVVRFEDNFDAVSNLVVIVAPAKKSSISDYGSPESFLSEFGYLLGRQSYSGFTSSEGGFATNEVATAAVLESSSPIISGKQYYKISILTRTADGDEGGKHQLITATVSDGKLYILKTQIGDKRWFKGSKRLAEQADNSFSVA